MRYGLFALAVVLTACGDGNNSSLPIQPAVDTTPPVIALTGNNPQVIAVGEAYVELGATATDNRDGDLSASIVIDASAVDRSLPGEYPVTYDVSDSSGNAAVTVTRTVIYEDRTAPVITLQGDNPQVIILGNPYVELGATASDNVDGNLTGDIVVNTDALDFTAVGDYQVTYDVSDAAGNAAETVTRTVYIRPPVPEKASVMVEGDIKKLIFSWEAVPYTDYYRLLENADGHSGFTQIGNDIPPDVLTASRVIAVHLFDWVEAQYLVEACNVTGCNTSSIVTVTGLMLDTIGYFKASNTDPEDRFGYSIAMSRDGGTLAIGAPWEDGSATGINGDQDNGASDTGAVYIFRNVRGQWLQEAYIKAPSLENDGRFGRGVALDADGDTLAIGLRIYRFGGVSWELQAQLSISFDGDYGGLCCPPRTNVQLSGDGNTFAYGRPLEDVGSGSVYLFRFDGSTWSQIARIRASNAGEDDEFGHAVALSNDGRTLAVGAPYEESSTTGVDSLPDDLSCSGLYPGAAYVFRYDGADWGQEAYIKSSKTDCWDRFGWSVALSEDASTLAVGAIWESSEAGVVHVFRHVDALWYHETLLEASNSGDAANFGSSVALSSDSNKLVIGAINESNSAVGVNGDENLGYARRSSAAYVFSFDGSNWFQQSYIKPPYVIAVAPRKEDGWPHMWTSGLTIALSDDGETLAIGKHTERSLAIGINSDPGEDLAEEAGAVFLY